MRICGAMRLILATSLMVSSTGFSPMQCRKNAPGSGSRRALACYRLAGCEKMKILMGMEGALNGYVAFNKRRSPLSVRDRGTSDGILAYVPVHGGITYVNKDQTACVFGFDTAHYNSEAVPRTDKNWIQWQCRVLYEGLVLAGKIEKDYVRAKGNYEKRRQVLLPLIDLVPEEDLGFGAIINVLSGEL